MKDHINNKAILTGRSHFMIWINIVIQIIFPLAVCFSPAIANANSAAPVSTLDSDTQARKAAGYASQAGSFLASKSNGEDAASLARGAATGAAGNEVQQWLSQFGTARVQLDADKNFSLKNSQFDLLVPLHDSGRNLVFAQGSLHRTEDRTQSNLGVGIRHFAADHMVGANIFGDYDLSRDHARAGVGLEYGRDFLKLAANSYLRLTGWKNAPELEDYQARPANGWDVRALAWLPALPQLGGKLTFEQYYGKEVTLFGKENRQRNPHAVTAGVNYTPVPLITLGAEHRQGPSGKNDARLSMDVNYRLGTPWQHQVNPDAVAALRSLAGSRLDLVERNNNIVLEYRKLELIRLRAASLVSGYAGEKKSLGVKVNSQYTLDHIDWSASTLEAAGGKIGQNGADYVVVLPSWQATPQGVNTYTVTGVAVDVKGNRSNRSETQVTVHAPEVSREKSTFTPITSTLQADGKSTQVLTLTIRNAQNQAVDVEPSDISVKSEAPKSATLSAPVRKSPGVYEVTVTAGTDTETVQVTPTVKGVVLSPSGVSMTSMAPDATQSQFGAAPQTIEANNTSESTLSLVARDASGHPVSGIKDSLAFAIQAPSSAALTAGAITLSAVMESATKGTYTATMKGMTPGKYTVTPLYNGSVIGSLSATVTLTASPASQEKSVIALDKTSYTAGDDMQVIVTLKDAAGNAVKGDAPALTAETVNVPYATLKANGTWQDNNDGTYSATYTATTTVTNAKASLLLSGWYDAAISGVYAINTGTPVPESAIVKTDKVSYLGGEKITVTVNIWDAYGNQIKASYGNVQIGDEIKAALKVPNSSRNGGGGMDYSGNFWFDFYAITPGTNLKATLLMSGWSKAVESSAFTIISNAPVKEKSGISIDKNSYVAGDEIQVRVTLKDATGDAATGKAALLIGSVVKVPNATLKLNWQDNGDGSYDATYVAVTPATSLQATLRLDGWSNEIKSANYSITPPPIMDRSGIATDKTAYMQGRDNIILTVTLNDAQGKAIIGYAPYLTEEAVQVPGANMKTGSRWQDNGDGTYTATYEPAKGGVNMKATLKLSGWVKALESLPYLIKGI